MHEDGGASDGSPSLEPKCPVEPPTWGISPSTLTVGLLPNPLQRLGVSHVAGSPALGWITSTYSSRCPQRNATGGQCLRLPRSTHSSSQHRLTAIPTRVHTLHTSRLSAYPHRKHPSRTKTVSPGGPIPRALRPVRQCHHGRPTNAAPEHHTSPQIPSGSSDGGASKHTPNRLQAERGRGTYVHTIPRFAAHPPGCTRQRRPPQCSASP